MLNLCVCVSVYVCRNASRYEQIFLRAITSEFQRTGVEETTFGEVSHMSEMCWCKISLCRTT